MEALRYVLSFEGYPKEKVFLRPVVEHAGVAFPHPAKDVASRCAGVWASLAKGCADPALKARFNHLLFEARVGRADLSARAAAESYVMASKVGWEPDDSLDFASAALRLAASVHDDDLHAEAARAVLTVIENAAEAGWERVVRDGLVRLVAERHLPFDIEDVAKAYLGTTLKGSDAADVWRAVAGAAEPGRRAQIAEEWVAALLWEAEQSPDQLRTTLWLGDALHVADQHGTPALKRVVATKLQDAAKTPLCYDSWGSLRRWTRAETTASDQPLIECPIADSLVQWVLMDAPPSGSSKDNRERAKALLECPLRAPMPVVTMSAESLPLLRAPEDPLDAELVRIESAKVRGAALTLARRLRRLGPRWRAVPQASLAGHLMTWPGMTDRSAWIAASGLTRYWARDYEGAFYVAVPRIERLIRDQLLDSGIGIYQDQRGEKPGQYPGIGGMWEDYCQALKMPDSWSRYFYSTLVHSGGINLRNAAAHGEMDAVGPGNAALALHLLLSLAVSPDLWKDQRD